MRPIVKGLIIGIGVIVTLLLIVITFAFLKNETFNSSLLVNHEKVAAYFTIVGSLAAVVGAIGAILSAVYLYQQLQILTRSLLAASHPDIFPETTILTATEGTTSNDNGEKVTGVVILKAEKSAVGSYIPEVRLYNVGIGTAKNIAIKWEYDNEEVIKYINNIYYYDLPDENEGSSLNFIRANEYEEVRAPSRYLISCGPALNSSDLLGNDKVQRPDLRLKICYTDLYLQSYEKTFKLDISTVANYIEMKFVEERSLPTI